MSMLGHSGHEHAGVGGFLTPRAGLVLIGFLIIGGALLFTEHRGRAGSADLDSAARLPADAPLHARQSRRTWIGLRD